MKDKDLAFKKCQQINDLAAALSTLEESKSIDLMIDSSVVLTLDDIKRYLESISQNEKRYVAFFRGDRFTVLRVVDNLDLRAVYMDEEKPAPKPKPDLDLWVSKVTPIKR